jgi:nucleoside-diphosphate-sugar epimerase
MLHLVTGGAGFLGSYLVNVLVDSGEQAIIIDDLSTGRVRNLEHALSSGQAMFVYADVSVPYPRLAEIVANATNARLDRIYHLASPAGPEAGGVEPSSALAVNGLATMSLVELALEHRARLMFASTCGVYGDPLVHPQPEGYFGNVDPVGPRSHLNEAKRFGEAVVAAAVRSRGLDGRIARLFNCYGPGMSEGDGQLVPAIIAALLDGRPIPIHGDGSQTRSMTYVSDAVDLMRIVMESPDGRLPPVNVGSDDERTVEAIARTLAALAGVEYSAVQLPQRPQDPRRRQPDLERARTLGWSASIGLEEGLLATYRWFREARLVYA